MYVPDQDSSQPNAPFADELADLFQGCIVIGVSKDSGMPFFHGNFSDKSTADGLHGFRETVCNWWNDQIQEMEDPDSSENSES